MNKRYLFVLGFLLVLPFTLAHEGEEITGVESHSFYERIGGFPTLLLIAVITLGVIALVYWFLSQKKEKLSNATFKI